MVEGTFLVMISIFISLFVFSLRDLVGNFNLASQAHGIYAMRMLLFDGQTFVGF